MVWWTPDNVSALYARATHYWNIALGMLEKLASGKQLNAPKVPMFIGSCTSLSKSEIKAYQEEGQLYLAVRLMDAEKLNEAAELLSKLSSPYGSYYLALVSNYVFSLFISHAKFSLFKRNIEVSMLQT